MKSSNNNILVNIEENMLKRKMSNLIQTWSILWVNKKMKMEINYLLNLQADKCDLTINEFFYHISIIIIE